MCIDLKNSGYKSSGQSVLLTVVGVALAIVLAVWCIRALPAALDQSLGIVPPSISSVGR